VLEAAQHRTAENGARAPRGLKPAPREGERGNAHVEFALVGIFILFAMISIFDIARGLWIYHTLAQAVRDGTRYAIVHGPRNVNPSTNVRLPGSTLADVLAVVRRSAIGIVPEELTLRFESAGVITCDPNCPGAALGQSWPPDGALDVSIQAIYPYRSLVVVYFPGMKGMNFGRFDLGSIARERIVF